jgi:hypothetical protein
VKPGPKGTPTATSTATPTPLSALLVPGQTVRFYGWQNDSALEGTVVGSERRSSLSDSLGRTYSPLGVYLVGTVAVRNSGQKADSVSIMTKSFRVQDSAGRSYDLAELGPQMAAQDSLGLPGVQDDIAPGATAQMVFAFDVMPDSVGLVLVSQGPW